MKVVTDHDGCEALMSGLDTSILNSHAYKRNLNEVYQPDSCLFLHADGSIFPLVVKNGLVTFYGGCRHNYASCLPEHPELLKEAIDYIVRKGYRFRLTSIQNDVLPLLSGEHRPFDVPYKVEWHYRQIRAYRPDLLMDGCSGKKLWAWKRVLRRQASYVAETLDIDDFTRSFGVLMQAHNSYFAGRGKISVWAGSEPLLLRILNDFHRSHRVLIRSLRSEGDWRAVYIILYNNRELIYYFGTSLSQGDHYASKVMYLDLLEQAKAIADVIGVDVLNGLAGAFTNKLVFGFSPRPLYALVHDPAWVARPDHDLSTDLYYQTYGRTFGSEASK